MIERIVYIPLPGQELGFIIKLLQQLIGKGHRIIIHCQNEQSLLQLDAALWSYEQLSFIPHATLADEEVVRQNTPINLLLDPINNVQADILLTYDINAPYQEQYSKILFICSAEPQGAFTKIVKQEPDASWKIVHSEK